MGTGTDQLGNMRSVDGDEDGMAVADIGAIESPAFAFFPAPPIATQARNDDVDLGDLDGDGDLDAFVTVRDGGNQVWLNDGTGRFVNSGQSLGNADNIYADLADLDGDGDLDAVVAALNRVFVWSNVGSAQFELHSQFDVQSAIDVTLNDVDSDGDQDMFVAQLDTDLVFLNDGTGNLIDSGQRLGNGRSQSVEMGDVDGDGDLDAVIGTDANFDYIAPNQIWLNDGNGIFTESPHILGSSVTQHVALGDLDGDGDLDAITANARGMSDPNGIWLNDGSGIFVDTFQRLGNSDTSHIALADVDNDGDLDAYAANGSGQPDILWINDGLGTFAQGQPLGMEVSSHVAIGDINGDSKPDAVVATFDIQPVVVWINRDGDMPHDFDGNSVLNSDDLDQLCVAIRDDVNNFRFDIDENGIIDQADLLLLQSQLQIGFGDITADGATDVSDFAVWNAHKFTANDPLLAGVGWSTGDLNCDGVTDISDFNIWNQHKFTSLQRESPAFDVSRLANPNDNDSDSSVGTARVIDQVFRS